MVRGERKRKFARDGEQIDIQICAKTKDIQLTTQSQITISNILN